MTEEVIIHCSCGGTYPSGLRCYSLTIDPPIYVEESLVPCPKCSKKYRRKTPSRLTPRHIHVLEGELI